MGQASSHGNFVHLYVNGLYFGLHNLTERLEDDFFSNHLGGDERDWEINEDFSSPGRRWSQMMHIDASTPEGFAEIQSFVDMENFADYMLLHFYADSEDWPHHNGYAAANTNSGDGRFRFFVWDQEIVLDKFTWNRYDRSEGVGALFQKLRRNSRVQVALRRSSTQAFIFWRCAEPEPKPAALPESGKPNRQSHCGRIRTLGGYSGKHTIWESCKTTKPADERKPRSLSACSQYS